MENEILLYVAGMKDKNCEDKITKELSKRPGIEMMQVNAKNGTVSMTGGDLDRLDIIDTIEALGYDCSTTT